MGRKIQHRGRNLPEVDHMAAGRDQTTAQRRTQFRSRKSAVTRNDNALLITCSRLATDGTAQLVGYLSRQCVAHHAAYVVGSKNTLRKIDAGFRFRFGLHSRSSCRHHLIGDEDGLLRRLVIAAPFDAGLLDPRFDFLDTHGLASFHHGFV